MRLAGFAFRHVQLGPRCKRRRAILDRMPVGNDKPVISPFLTQHLREKPLVFRRLHAVDGIVRAHHGPRRALRDRPLEPGEIDLAQRPLADVRTGVGAVDFRIVAGEMLQRGADTVVLQAADQGCGEIAVDDRILGIVFVGATGQRRPPGVDPGPRRSWTPS